MMYTGSSRLDSQGQATSAQIQAWLEDGADAGAAYVGLPVLPIYPEAGRDIVDMAIWARINPDLMAADIAHESAWLQSRIYRDKYNPSGLGATNDDPYNKAVTFDHPRKGIQATAAHFATYVYGEGDWTALDPRYGAVKSAGWLGVVTVLTDLNGKWAWPGTQYGQALARLANDLLQFAASLSGEEPPMALTDTIAGRIAAKGVEAYDIRSKMRRHDTDRYRRLPNTAWLYTGVHHTAVSRGVRGLQGDIDSWVGHSVYHVGTHGWPGIAYAIGISLSGRVFILRDIEEEGYHAFSANNNSIGICGDLTIGNPITAAFKTSLNAVLGVLHAAPEFPNLKDRAGTYGHQELAFVDNRNSGTSCPGDVLPLVREYRAGADTPVVPLGDALVLPNNPFGDVPVVLGFKGLFLDTGAVKYPDDPIAGGVSLWGYPEDIEYETATGSAQVFERAVFLYHRNATRPFDLVVALRSEGVPERKAA